MAFKNLREFLDLLEERDELRRIRVEVDPHLEITEIADRVMKAGGPAIAVRERARAATFRWRSICLDHSNE